MKGIVLAGGTGSRLWPVTMAVSKQLLPVYDKPMIFYPLSTLMLAGIREILLITTPHDQEAFRRVLGDGSQWGISIEYAAQPSPDGLAQAFIIGERFLDGSPSALVLGDNIFHGQRFGELLRRAAERTHGAEVFGYWVQDPRAYGVAEFDAEGRVTDVVEKPEHPRSNYAITGLYFYDGRASQFARELVPSSRGELEITDLNRRYLRDGSLELTRLPRGFAWLDTGTFETLLAAGNFVEVLEQRQGLRISSPEEIAWRHGFIDDARLLAAADRYQKSAYGTYLRDLLARGDRD